MRIISADGKINMPFGLCCISAGCGEYGNTYTINATMNTDMVRMMERYYNQQEMLDALEKLNDAYLEGAPVFRFPKAKEGRKA